MSLKEALGNRKTKQIKIEGCLVTINMIDMSTMFDAIEIFNVLKPLFSDKKDKNLDSIVANKDKLISFISKVINEDEDTVSKLNFSDLVEIILAIVELNEEQLFLGIARAEELATKMEKQQKKTGSTPSKPLSVKATA